jgi:hypothetical protein
LWGYPFTGLTIGESELEKKFYQLIARWSKQQRFVDSGAVRRPLPSACLARNAEGPPFMRTARPDGRKGDPARHNKRGNDASLEPSVKFLSDAKTKLVDLIDISLGALA